MQLSAGAEIRGAPGRRGRRGPGRGITAGGPQGSASWPGVLLDRAEEIESF